MKYPRSKEWICDVSWTRRTRPPTTLRKPCVWNDKKQKATSHHRSRDNPGRSQSPDIHHTRHRWLQALISAISSKVKFESYRAHLWSFDTILSRRAPMLLGKSQRRSWTPQLFKSHPRLVWTVRSSGTAPMRLMRLHSTAKLSRVDSALHQLSMHLQRIQRRRQPQPLVSEEDRDHAWLDKPCSFKIKSEMLSGNSPKLNKRWVAQATCGHSGRACQFAIWWRGMW